MVVAGVASLAGLADSIAGNLAGDVAGGWERAVETAPEGFAMLSREVRPEPGTHLRGLGSGGDIAGIVADFIAEILAAGAMSGSITA